MHPDCISFLRVPFAFIFVIGSFIACNNNEDLSGKRTGLPNEVFSKKIIPALTDSSSIVKFHLLLTGLDNKGISYCQFVQRLTQLDDSCYSVAKRKYPDPENEDEFVKLHLQATMEAEAKYLSALNLDMSFSTFATAAYNTNQDIRSFCNGH